VAVTGHRTRLVAALVVLGLVAAVLVVWHQRVQAPAFRASAVVDTVGRALQTEVVFAGRTAATAAYAGICFTDAAGAAVDFPLHRDVAIGTAPVTLSTSASLAAGTYGFTPCLRVDGAWSQIGTAGSVVVTDDAIARSAATPTGSSSALDVPVGTATSAASAGASAGTDGTTSNPLAGNASTPGWTAPAVDAAMPVGDLPGWKQIFTEDFTTDLPEGRFPGAAYRDRWLGYDGFEDFSSSFTYATKDVVSVHDGTLDMRVRTEDGVPLGAGIAALVNGDGSWGGRTYGRYSVRFRSVPTRQWGAAFLVWSDVDDWDDGEIDFAEGRLDGTVDQHNHRPDDPSVNDLSVRTGAAWTDWHVATAEWTPDGVTFLLDDVVTGRSTASPDQPMHLVLQTISNHVVPPADATGNLLVDWVTGYEMAP